MREQLAHRDRVLTVDGKFRPVFGDGVVELQLPAFDQLHDGGGGGDDLGQRGEIEQRVDRHRLLFRLLEAIAEGFAIGYALVVADDDHRTGHLAGAHLGLGDAVDCGQVLGAQQRWRGIWHIRQRGRIPKRGSSKTTVSVTVGVSQRPRGVFPSTIYCTAYLLHRALLRNARWLVGSGHRNAFDGLRVVNIARVPQQPAARAEAFGGADLLLDFARSELAAVEGVILERLQPGAEAHRRQLVRTRARSSER